MKKIDKNSIAKEERILKAAEDVFSRRGFESATVDEIITLADVGKGTVYKYFGNKEQLFYKLVYEKNQRFVKLLKQAVASRESFQDKLVAYYREMIHFYRANSAMWQIIFFEMSDAANGCQANFFDNDIEIVSRYGDTVSEETRERVKRYTMLLFEECNILIQLFQEAKEQGIIKSAYPDVSAKFFFFGVTMIIIRGDARFTSFADDEIAKEVVRFYLYGDAIK